MPVSQTGDYLSERQVAQGVPLPLADEKYVLAIQFVLVGQPQEVPLPLVVSTLFFPSIALFTN